uniref:Uncharacterized protein n=1 Tax=Sphaerodactylus townsendi TaxID=933632 RepID=A0ACB8FEX3_9SAUR
MGSSHLLPLVFVGRLGFCRRLLRSLVLQGSLVQEVGVSESRPVTSHLGLVPSNGASSLPTHLSREVVEDVAAVRVQDGDGLSEMVSLSMEKKEMGLST